jgi:hypothetical protein
MNSLFQNFGRLPAYFSYNEFTFQKFGHFSYNEFTFSKF